MNRAAHAEIAFDRKRDGDCNAPAVNFRRGAAEVQSMQNVHGMFCILLLFSHILHTLVVFCI